MKFRDIICFLGFHHWIEYQRKYSDGMTLDSILHLNAVDINVNTAKRKKKKVNNS